MKFTFRLIYGVVALLLPAAAASASPITWTLHGVTLTDGGTARGTFTFDPDAGTPCGNVGSVSPCGTYSNLNIVTTNGSLLSGATYSFVCGKNVVSCAGVKADTNEVLFLTSNAANQSGDRAIAFFFNSPNGLPLEGLTDAGGIVDISGGSVGTVTEGTCADAACSSYSRSSPVRFSIAGTVSSTPEPTTWLLLTAGFALIATLRRRRLAWSPLMEGRTRRPTAVHSATLS